MLRKEIEKQYGENWWKRHCKIDFDHTISLCARGIDEQITNILKYGVIYPHPEKPKRYMCVHKDSCGEYTTLIFIPTRYSNIVITGFPSKPEQIIYVQKN